MYYAREGRGIGGNTMRSQLFLATFVAVFFVSAVEAQTLCPDGTYVGGESRASWLRMTRMFQGTSLSSWPRMEHIQVETLNWPRMHSYVGGGGDPRLCPDGTYVVGECELTPNGSYVGEDDNNAAGDDSDDPQ